MTKVVRLLATAAGAQLVDDNTDEPHGDARALRFAQGRWQDTPHLAPTEPSTTDATDIPAAAVLADPALFQS